MKRVSISSSRDELTRVPPAVELGHTSRDLDSMIDENYA